MSQINQDMNIHQGINFDKSVVDKVGYITKMTVGKTAFEADVSVAKIDDPKTTQNVVAVLVNSGWDGNPGGPLGFYGVLTDKNKKSIRILLADNMVDRSIKVEFECWAYDKEKRNYFKTFHSKDVEIEGELVVSGGGKGNIDLWVEEQEIPDVQQPALYQFGFSLTSATKKQELHYAVDTGAKMARAFGVPVKTG